MELCRALALNNRSTVCKLRNELNAVWKTAQMKVTSTDNVNLFTDPSIKLSGEFKVRLVHDQFIALNKITEKTSIFCPVHEVGEGHTPSAFVGMLEKGGRFIYCASCADGDTKKKVFKFK